MAFCVHLEDDFNISSIVAVFNPGEMESFVFISVRNDLVLEQDELFDVVLVDSNNTGIRVGMPRTAEVTIMNSNSEFLCNCVGSGGEPIIGLAKYRLSMGYIGNWYPRELIKMMQI